MRYLLLLSLIMINPSYAIEIVSNVTNIEHIKRHTSLYSNSNIEIKKITVGFVAGLSPYDIYLKEEEQYKGISADYLYIIKSLLDIDVDLVAYNTRQDAILAIKNGEIDLLTTSNGYELKYGLTLSSPYKKSVPAIFTNSKTKSRLKNIGMYNEYLPSEKIRKKLPGINLIEYSTPKEAILSVVSNQTDGMITDVYSANYLKNIYYIDNIFFHKFIDMDSNGFSFSLSPDNGHLLKILNALIKEINKSNLIDNKWNGGGVSLPNYDTLIKVRDKKNNSNLKENKINVGLLKYAAPVSYLSRNNEPQGIIVELLELIKVYSGVKFNYVFYTGIDDIENDLKNGIIDISTMVKSSERQNEFIFSHNIIKSEYAKIENKNKDSSKKGSIFSIKNNDLESKLMLSNEDFFYVDSFFYALEELSNNTGDSYAIVPILSANYYISKYFSEKLSLTEVYSDLPEANVNLVANKNKKEILNFLSDVIYLIPDNDINLITNRWQKNSFPEQETWKDYKYTIITITISSSIFLLFILFSAYLLIKGYKNKLKIQDELEIQLEFMQVLLDSIPQPIYVRDDKLDLVISNYSFKVSKLKVDSGAPQNNPSILLKSDYVKSINDGVPILKDRCFLLGDNKVHVYHWIQPFDLKLDKKGIICGWIDITEKISLLDELSEAKEKAESANVAKSQFLATVSHEIRTPINAIFGFLEVLLKSDNVPQQEKDMIGMAFDSSRDLSNLIGDILDMSKIESGKILLVPEKNNIKELVFSIHKTYSNLAKNKGLDFSLCLDENISDELVFDLGKLKQVLINIIGNAIKFTDTGEIKLYLNLCEKLKTGNIIEIKLIDQGIGIPKDAINNIFNAFSQADNHSGLGGTGLGLMISKSICDLMNANFSIESNVGVGTCVSIKMNLQFPYDTNSSKILKSLDKGSFGCGTVDTVHQNRGKILIVDDHAPNRMLLKHQLSYLKFHAEEACSGKEALEKIHNNDFILIITDCNMPNMNGHELTRYIRASETIDVREPIKILGYTANALQSEKDKCLTSGMDDCLFKPLSIEQLNNKINSMLYDDFLKPSPSCEDFERIHSLTEGDIKLVKDILKEIKRENISDNEKIITFMKAKNFNKCKETAHKIKSVADMLDDDYLKSLCLAIIEMDSEKKLQDDILKLNTHLEHINQKIDKYCD